MTSPTPKILAAPLQGITDAVWRNAHHAVFGGVDAYYAPFMRVERGEIRRRDLTDAAPQHNTAPLVPQLLASPPAEAVMLATALRDMGYQQIDINLGCPHPPVARRHKGCGMLAVPAMLEEMCRALWMVEGVRYSVKMRLGWDAPHQWRDALPAIAAITPTQVTIHPRMGTQQYRGELLINEFELLLAQSPYPVVFNGEIRTAKQVGTVLDRYPQLHGVMIGRGLAMNPAILDKSKNKSEYYVQFHQALLEGESERLTGGEHQLLSHIKSLWTLLLPDADKRLRKRVIKATSMAAYQAAVSELLRATLP
ncbi:MAG: tRNA-dihydrouridine synthase family protein [Muribaculaceae bacterium]|nr:tRNA-dihydrouridine synthase family protein [Muribaculaceae bacterium]